MSKINISKKKIETNKKVALFVSNRSIVVRAKYQGDQLQAWLSYYQPEKKFARPKSTQTFAVCVEDKRRQQGEFEKVLKIKHLIIVKLTITVKITKSFTAYYIVNKGDFSWNNNCY